MIVLLAFLWYLRTARQLMFVLYLWQLKEYHIGRFFEYFRTEKGKRALFHPFALVKLVLLGLLFVFPLTAIVLLLGVYIVESTLAFSALRRGTLLLPVFTQKTVVLLISAQAVQLLFFTVSFMLASFTAVLILLLFDILTIAIGSALVLLWQPYTVFMRSGILRKAKAKRREMKNLKTVGITGSYGKTSTKDILAYVLSLRFVTLKTPEHRNSEVGVAQTILYDLTDEHEVFVCEMGAYGKGGVRLLAGIAQPNVGVVAGVNDQHLSLFGSRQNLLSAEGGGELASSLPNGAVMIVNYDSIPLREHATSFKNVVWCSAQEKKDVYARDVIVERESLSFTLVAGNEETRVETSLLGAWNVENMVLAAAAALELGMNLKEVAQGLSSLPKELGSMHMKKGKGFTILDSSYSANPDGVLAGLEHLKLWDKRRVVVMPPLIELGSAAREAHVKIGEKIAECADYAIITGRDYKKDIVKGVEKGKMSGDNIFFLENSGEIADKIFRIVQEGDVVLLEGRVPSSLLPLLLS